jgi:hypothetical protein
VAVLDDDDEEREYVTPSIVTVAAFAVEAMPTTSNSTASHRLMNGKISLFILFGLITHSLKNRVSSGDDICED